MNVRRKKLLVAALAGLTAGLGSASELRSEEKSGEVKCYGVNGCGSHAKCAVSQADLDAVKKLLGEKAYEKQFGKSEVHACGSHAKCGASAQILNWTTTSAAECGEQGGILIEEKVGKEGKEGKRVAKKA